jgi:hypothetical protein
LDDADVDRDIGGAVCEPAIREDEREGARPLPLPLPLVVSGGWLAVACPCTPSSLGGTRERLVDDDPLAPRRFFATRRLFDPRLPPCSDSSSSTVRLALLSIGGVRGWCLLRCDDTWPLFDEGFGWVFSTGLTVFCKSISSTSRKDRL